MRTFMLFGCIFIADAINITWNSYWDEDTRKVAGIILIAAIIMDLTEFFVKLIKTK